MKVRTNKARLGACAAAVAAAVTLGACGSTNSSSTNSSSGGGSSASTASTTASAPSATAAYTGPEATLPKSYPAVKVTGKNVKIGLVCPICSLTGNLLTYQKAKDEVGKLGGTAILDDAAGSPQTQLNQFRQLIAQGVKAIVLQPLDESAFTQAFTMAKQQGVRIITIADPGDTSQPLQAGVDSDVSLGYDQAEFDKMRYLASVLPKGAEFALIGYGAPNATVQYLVSREKYWGEHFGLKLADEVDVSDLTAAGGQNAANSILAQHPNVRAILSFTDGTNPGVATAVRLKSANVIICGQDFDRTSLAILATGEGCDTRWAAESIGKLAGEAAYSAATNQNLPLPKIVATHATLVTPKNYKTVPVAG